MLSVVIKDQGEAKVTELTYEILWRELKDIPKSEIFIDKDWFAPLSVIKNNYVCFVEADCLVSSGYFQSQMGLIKKDPYLRKMGILSSVTGVNNWANRFYGYQIDKNQITRIMPIREKRSNAIGPIQIAYIPGSIIRVNMLRKLLEKDDSMHQIQDELVMFSTKLSLDFWQEGDGNRVYINPNACYVTTEDYVNDLGTFKFDATKLLEKFERESI